MFFPFSLRHGVSPSHLSRQREACIIISVLKRRKTTKQHICGTMKGIVPYNDIHIALSKHGYVSASVPNSLYVTASFVPPLSPGSLSPIFLHTRRKFRKSNQYTNNIYGTIRSSYPTMLCLICFGNKRSLKSKTQHKKTSHISMTCLVTHSGIEPLFSP